MVRNKKLAYAGAYKSWDWSLYLDLHFELYFQGRPSQ